MRIFGRWNVRETQLSCDRFIILGIKFAWPQRLKQQHCGVVFRSDSLAQLSVTHVLFVIRQSVWKQRRRDVRRLLRDDDSRARADELEEEDAPSTSANPPSHQKMLIFFFGGVKGASVGMIRLCPGRIWADMIGHIKDKSNASSWR